MLSLVLSLLLSVTFASPVPSDRLYLFAGGFILEADPLHRFYQGLNGQFQWVESGRPSSKATQLRESILKAEQQGLIPAHYWSELHEKLYQEMNPSRERTFEILATDALIRYAEDLSRGQVIEPDLIDEDIKVRSKNEKILERLIEIVRSSSNLTTEIEKLAPQNPHYQNLLVVLRHLQELKSTQAWGNLEDPGIEIKPGMSHPVIKEIKIRLQSLGYGTLSTSENYDNEMEAAVQRYQRLNSLPRRKNINSQLIQSLAPDLDKRIKKLRVNLEKLRWFPQNWESRHLFVNLAFQEAQVIENNRPVLMMKTVNGRPTRRTPTLRDEIRFVEPQPTWTVPFSIAVKDKLDLLKRDPQLLLRQQILVHDQNRVQIDPYQVNWQSVDRNNWNYVLIQQPGPHNSLGLIKFPLTNPWFIYLHDTNEPHLMNESLRLRSSGCVRLEKPWELTAYLLRDKPEWTKSRLLQKQYSTQQIYITQNLPVYFLYLTVARESTGEIRFAEDYYGQDMRLNELFETRGSIEKF